MADEKLSQIFAKLADIYDRLGNSFPKLEHNPCAGCNEHTVCCRADVISSHVISGLEMAYLHEVYPEHDLDIFREFVKRKKDNNGDFIHMHCPFYSKAQNGCAVYKARPFSCRLFGPYFLESTGVPVYCGFKDIGTRFKRGDYFKIVPQAKELAELKTLFYSRFTDVPGVRTAGAETMTEEEETGLMESGDPFVRGKILHNQKRYEEALREYLETAKENEQSPTYYFHLACLYQDMGRAEDAMVNYEKVLSFDPDNPYVPLKLGILYELEGKTREAIMAYRRTLSINERSAIAHGNLGFIHLERKEFPEALEHLLQATTLDSANGYYFLGLGSALVAFDRLEEARTALTKSIELTPMEIGYILLAELTDRLGDHEKAKMLREEALKVKLPD